ncbi:hypothetical protein PV08_07617 [Exophiala spinifera]|uniref:Uncharacterized protein n=1 Tax=Exophiala spinifera TaxID=91928 RepID=A0A0D1ZPT7_9EURO|nr:uncharacterized protein PV08_07617 [Exophiala spinifera]KIW14832.1 hypothetical protein PV08_07617 [Exophiala spinifera]
MPVLDKLDKLIHPKKASAEAPPTEDQAPQPTATEVPAAAPAVEATPHTDEPKRRQSLVDKILHRRSSSAERKTEATETEEGATKKEKFHWPHLGGKGSAKEEKKPEREEPAAEGVVPAA